MKDGHRCLHDGSSKVAGSTPAHKCAGQRLKAEKEADEGPIVMVNIEGIELSFVPSMVGLDTYNGVGLP